jgi:hypothetical protein
MRAIFLILSVLFIIGCQEEQVHYTMPSDQFYTETIISSEPEYHQAVIQSEIHSVDRMEQFDEWRRQREAEDKYDAYSEAWNRDLEIDEKEDELEAYCNSLFSNSCLDDMKEYCDHDGCRNVTVECDKFRDSDDVCVKYDISIADELK